jgi:hypothetical protein
MTMRVGRIISFIVAVLGAGCGSLLIASVVSAQPPQTSFAGKYNGTAKDATGEVKVSLDLKDDGGKFSGTLGTSRGDFTINKGQIVDNALTLDISGTMSADASTGKITLRKKDDTLVGELSINSNKPLPLELHKSVTDEISGEWDAVADAQGQAVPFTLSLKLDGDKISGTSDSQLGHFNIVSGSWKDGKFSIVLDGNVALVATMVEGKLSGDYDFQGQSSGKWVAVRKK